MEDCTGIGVLDVGNPAALVFPEAYGSEAERERMRRDLDTYDLSTTEGRRAWKRATPAGTTRTIPEDGAAWVDLLAATVAEQASAWLYETLGVES